MIDSLYSSAQNMGKELKNIKNELKEIKLEEMQKETQILKLK